MKLPKRVWRLGHPDDPIGFCPRDLCQWINRFDDPLRLYRTLYCSQNVPSCFRERFQDLRPDPRALAELAPARSRRSSVFDIAAQENRGILAACRIVVKDGRLFDLERLDLRRDLTSDFESLLDIPELRGPRRSLTQRLGRTLYDRGAAGIAYWSKIHNSRCYALFEGRAHLEPNGRRLMLRQAIDQIRRLCEDFALKLELP